METLQKEESLRLLKERFRSDRVVWKQVLRVADVLAKKRFRSDRVVWKLLTPSSSKLGYWSFRSDRVVWKRVWKEQRPSLPVFVSEVTELCGNTSGLFHHFQFKKMFQK